MSRQVLDAQGLGAKLNEMADAVAEMIRRDADNAVLMGIRTRGVTLAQRLKGLLAERHGLELPLGILDITLYRDDLSTLDTHPIVRHTLLDFDVTDRLVLLIDDVLYTGRTVRSAMDEIVDFGRPRAIRLVVMIDRGGREYPIQADWTALQIPTGPREVVKVELDEIDGEDKVVVATLPETVGS